MHNIIICNDKRKPIDYIIKKLRETDLEENIDFVICSMEEILKSLNKVDIKETTILPMNNFNENKESIIRCQYNNKNVKIGLSEITYIQKERYGCIIHVTKEKSENDYAGQLYLREKLDIIYQKLKNYGFEYAHSSYLVNISHVNECNRTQLTLDVGVNLDISRSKSKQFNERFINYIDKFLEE